MKQAKKKFPIQLEKKTSFFQKWKIRIILAGVLLFTGLIYLHTSKFSFVYWDDDENIKKEASYSVLSPENFLHHYKVSRYKALAIWSFIIDSAVFGKKPGWFHFHNVLLHLVNILLLYLLMQRITKKETVALITAALFGLHPVFIEPVAWVTGRKDLLFMLFTLLSVLTYQNYLLKKRNFFYLLPVFAFAYLASLAKIQVFTIPLLLFGLDWYYKRKITAELILEKVILFMLISDKWKLFVLLFLLFLFLKLLKPELMKNFDKKPAYLFWYLIIISFFVLFFFWKIFDIEGIKVLIIPIISLLSYGILFYFALEKKSVIIGKLSGLSVLKKRILLFAPIIVIFLEFTIRFFLSNSFLNNLTFSFWSIEQGSPSYFSFVERFLLAGASLTYYVLRFFLINSQNPMIPYPERTADGALPDDLLVKSIIAFILIAVLIFLIFRYGRKNRGVIIGLLWFMASISIVIHIIPIEGRVLVADRYAYPAFIGLFLVVALIADYFLQRFRPAPTWTVLATIVLLLGGITYVQCSVWENSVTLWQKAIDENPHNHYAWFSLGNAVFFEKNKPDEAMYYFDKAISMYSSDYQYFNNRGRIKFAVRDMKGAMDDFNKAIEKNKMNWSTFYNRGVLRMETLDFKGAADDFRRAKEIFPEYTLSDTNLQKTIYMAHLDSVLNDPYNIRDEDTADMIIFIRRVGRKCTEYGMYEKAVSYLEKGIELFPAETGFYQLLATTYDKQLNKASELETYNRGLKRLPANPDLLLERGKFYQANGQNTKACADWQQAAQAGSSDAQNMLQRYCGLNL